MKLIVQYYYIIVLLGWSTGLVAQNVGIGNSSPLDKLHVSGGFVRVDTLASADTNVVVSDVNGRLINLGAGNAGEVLTSQGPGLAPRWAAAGGSPGKIHFGSRTTSFSLTVNNSFAPSGTLLDYNFIPTNDTVIMHFSSQCKITSDFVPYDPSQVYLYRIYLNGSLYKQTYISATRNEVSGGAVPASFSMPIAVNPGLSNNVEIVVFSLFTTSGSQTIELNPSSLSQYANVMIYDFPTN